MGIGAQEIQRLVEERQQSQRQELRKTFHQQREQFLNFVKEASPRGNWHEPDEQGISARIVGDHLDNAMGDSIYSEEDRYTPEHQEFVIELSYKSYELKETPNLLIQVNLATLSADYCYMAKRLKEIHNHFFEGENDVN